MKNSKLEDACCAHTETKFLLRRPIFIVFTVVAVTAAGLYFKWPSIVALGFVPFILSIAPCVLMCVVGMCGMGNSKTEATAPNRIQDNNS